MLLPLLLSFAVLLFVGAPVALGMGAAALAALVIGGNIPLVILPQRMLVALDSFPLLAVPLFILAGELMNGSGITQRLVAFASALVGAVRGGLAHVAIVASMFFSGLSGSALADCAAIGKVLIPAMRREGYDRDFAVSVVASASTMGPIIPPSILMIVYAAMTNVSVGALFLAGLIPGVLICAALLVVASVVAHRRNYPRRPPMRLAELRRATWRALPPLMAPVIILGGILGGVFTATEAGAVAVLYALVLGVIWREISFAQLRAALLATAITSSAVLLVISCATIFGWIMAIEQFPRLLVGWMEAVALGPVTLMLAVILVLLVLGLFVDGLALLIILVPVLAPVSVALGVDPIQMALVVILCVMVGGVTPPVGILLYVACGAGDTKLSDIGGLVWVFVGALTLVTVGAALWPGMTLWLPRALL